MGARAGFDVNRLSPSARAGVSAAQGLARVMLRGLADSNLDGREKGFSPGNVELLW